MARPGFWIDTLVGSNITAGTPVVLTLLTNVTAVQPRRGWTCVRTIIGLSVAYTVHDAGEGSQNFFMGIGVASREAFGASPQTISDPEVATDFPLNGWLYRAGYRILGFAADQAQYHLVRIEKDIRAKRKLSNGEMFLAFSTALNEGAAGTIHVIGFIRQYWLDE